MGIKGYVSSSHSQLILINRSIYGEIGPGERIAFSKLVVEKLEKTGTPFRIAIDVSIWQFQTQAGQGGSNPAIRTFYYRLLRLLSISVQPVFIFDGPNKPPFKRGKKTHAGGARVSDMLTKQMLTLFGFPFYRAPGEAEAECAFIQRAGIVDAVLSEDVDTLMFGCGVTLRNWSSEGTRGNKAPTHVSVYDAKATKEGKSGLDREGMVLVALMSGGDYTEGIPGCGIKLACQAARAGYGKSLCRILRDDTEAMDAWRSDLKHEIETNQSKHFRTKHASLDIDANWPDKRILRYYTHPVVSSAARLERLKEELVWDAQIDIPGLRQFVADAFDWTNKAGVIKFIRGIAPVLLVHKLLLRRNRRDSGYGDIVLTAMNEMELVRSIAAERRHFSTDASRELRLVYMPIDIVGLNLDEEHDDEQDYDRDGLAPLGEDDLVEGYVSEDGEKIGRGPSQYDPKKLDKVWVSATIARIGIPLKVEDYEECLNAPKKVTKKPVAKKVAKKAPAKKSVMPQGAMDRFVSTSKPSVAVSNSVSTDYEDDDSLPPFFLASMLERAPLATKTSEVSKATHPAGKLRNAARHSTSSRKSSLSKSTTTNPWSLSTTSEPTLPTARITKSIATTKGSKPIVYDLLSSSPIAYSFSPHAISVSTPTKHRHSPEPPLSPLPSPIASSNKRASLTSVSSLDAHEELGLPSTVTISRHRSRRHQRDTVASRIQSPSHLSVKERNTSPSLLQDDLDDFGHEDLSALTYNDDEIADIARKIDFSAAKDVGLEHVRTSSTFSSFVEQDLDLGLDSEPEHEKLPYPAMRHSQSRFIPAPVPEKDNLKVVRKVVDVIDLSSSPPTASHFPVHPQSQSPQSQSPTPTRSPKIAKQKYKASSTIQSFLNSTKSAQINNNTNTKSNGTIATTKTTTKKQAKVKRRKIITLRASLAGAWRELSEDEADLDGQKEIGDGKGMGRVGKERREGRWRMSEVEVLDLTGAD